MKKILRKLNSKAFKIWAVSFAAVLIVGFSILAIVLSSKKVEFGLPLELSNIREIKYFNDDNQKLLLTNINRESYDNAIDEILNLLDKAHKTNKLKQTFGQAGGDYSVENNNSGYSTVSNFESRHKQFLRITFNTPTHEITGRTNQDYQLATINPDTDMNYRIWMILIPLEDIKNSFEKQTWYLVRHNPKESTNPPITNKFTTYGNYYKLANFVANLKVL